MPRTYKRALGSRTYCNYFRERLEESLKKIRNGEISKTEASETYKIPVKTIYNNLEGKIHTKKPGG